MCLYSIVHALVVDLNPELRIMSPLFYHCATATGHFLSSGASDGIQTFKLRIMSNLFYHSAIAASPHLMVTFSLQEPVARFKPLNLG